MAPEEDYWKKVCWPFEVLHPERQSDQHTREIRFLQKAYGAGFRPYRFGAGNLGAEAEGERVAVILVRGRKRWEVSLGTGEHRAVSAFMDDFHCAAAAVLRRLRGEPTDTLLHDLQEHVVEMPGSRDPVKS